MRAALTAAQASEADARLQAAAMGEQLRELHTACEEARASVVHEKAAIERVEVTDVARAGYFSLPSSCKSQPSSPSPPPFLCLSYAFPLPFLWLIVPGFRQASGFGAFMRAVPPREASFLFRLVTYRLLSIYLLWFSFPLSILAQYCPRFSAPCSFWFI